MKSRNIVLSIFFVFVIIVIFIIRGNFFRYNDISFYIKEPTSNNLQIEGKWILEDVKELGITDKVFNSDDFKNIYISNNFVKFGKYYTEFPKFKFRYVNLDKYFSFKGIIENNLKSSDKNENIVVTVDDGDFFYQEFVKLDDEHIVVIMGKRYLTYKLESKTFDKESIDKNDLQVKIGRSITSDEIDTTLLIGLKDTSTLSYNTIIFRKEFEKNPVIKKTKGIFLNKNNSFFLVDNVVDNNGKQKGIYISSDYLRADDKMIETNGNINYIGENYLSLEVLDKNNGQKKYELYSNENLKKDEKISIVELAGQVGKVSYYDSLRKIRDYSLDNFFEDIDNIGVYRKNYNWKFKSVYNNNSSDKLSSTEFDLDIIPLLPIFENYTNKIHANIIKNRVPDFIDYFISPNGNLACVLNSHNFYIFNIENKQLSTNPISTFEIPAKSEVVMFQWKTNESSELTFKELSKLSTNDIEYR